MEIGQKEQKKKLVQDKNTFIDPSFFKIQFSINGKVFKQAVDGLLTFETENLDDLTDEDAGMGIRTTQAVCYGYVDPSRIIRPI